MTIYRCSQCQFATSDPGVPECPHCHQFLTEVEGNTEDWLEEDDSHPAMEGREGLV
jgi:hypothetical protein